MQSNTPTLALLIGIPASGKSTVAKELSEKGYSLLSSDRIRGEIYGEGMPTDEKERDRLAKAVFNRIRSEAKKLLSQGRSVVIDATNLSRKKRMKLLSYLGLTPCYKRAYLLITSHEVCLQRNAMRPTGQRAPDEDMLRLMREFEIPVLGEGWDEILPIIHTAEYHFPHHLLNDFNQDNPHHTLTLGKHMEAARRYAEEHGYRQELICLCALHDIGKLYTKEYKNYKGEPSDIAHFYGHENVGAYLYLAMECCGREHNREELDRIFYRAALINCHMRPLVAWRDSAKAKERDKMIFGEDFIADIEKINAADGAAH